MYLGAHVSIAGKIYDSLERTKLLGCNAMQIFSRNPRQWRELKLSKVDVKEFKKRRKAYGIDYVVVHIPYLINLASPYDVLYKISIRAYIEDLNETQALGAEFLVTHMGSHAKTSEEEGIERFANALNEIFDKTKGNKVKLLLENTSGSGSWLGYTFQHHKMIFDRVKLRDRLGVCLDTAHAFAAGYDLRKQEGLVKLLVDIDTLIGLDKVKVVHLNDSKKDFDSHLDQHDHIGAGKIGLRGMQGVVRSKQLKDKVFILETPKKNDDDDLKNVTLVRGLAK